MAHFAQLDENNQVINVVVVNNEHLLDENNVEIEALGIAHCKKHLGQDTNWVQTSYNNSFRKRYAGIGYIYDADRDVFIPPKPFNSWNLNEDTLLWEAPIPMPVDGNLYRWEETTLSWIIQ